MGHGAAWHRGRCPMGTEWFLFGDPSDSSAVPHFPGGCLGLPTQTQTDGTQNAEHACHPPMQRPRSAWESQEDSLCSLPRSHSTGASPIQRKGRTSPILSALGWGSPGTGPCRTADTAGHNNSLGSFWRSTACAVLPHFWHTTSPKFSKGTEAAPGGRPGVKGWRAGAIPTRGSSWRGWVEQHLVWGLKTSGVQLNKFLSLCLSHNGFWGQ